MDPFMPKYDVSSLPATIQKAVSLGLELTVRDHVRSTMRTSEIVLCIACDDCEIYAPHIFLSEKAYLSLKKNLYGEKYEETDAKGREILYNVYYHNEDGKKVENYELFIITKPEPHLYRVIGCYRWPSCPVCSNRDILFIIYRYLFEHNPEVYRLLRYPRVMKKQVVYIQ